MTRSRGPSVRLKLTLSYAGFLMVAGGLMLAAVWVFLARAYPAATFAPRFSSLPLVLNPTNFGPSVFGTAAVLLLVFLLLFGLVGGWLLAGRMLAPLDRISEATRVAATGSLAHRIRLPGRNDEFRELADTFDAMLAQLEAHAAEQQRFAANASHELRTPLAITQALLEVAQTDPDRDNGDLVDRLQLVNSRAIELTEALLLLSRADTRSFVPEHVDLSLLGEEAAETLLPFAEERGVVIETSSEATPTLGSPALLLQLTTNLLQNAIVHNLPERGSVQVRAGVQPEGAVLTVENTGEQLTPQFVASLGKPFLRGSGRVRTDHGGVGLGLAIVTSIARAHDGTLTLTARDGGGLRASLTLPHAV